MRAAARDFVPPPWTAHWAAMEAVADSAFHVAAQYLDQAVIAAVKASSLSQTEV